jgi:phosphoribosyl-AMP cyclohydrolase
LNRPDVLPILLGSGEMAEENNQPMESKATAEIDFDKGGGVVPVVAQDYTSGRLLMVAYMNREAFDETVRTGRACYFSRSRNRLWRKGEESGNHQTVREIRIDCDSDTILLRVDQHGDRAACHEGYESCFFRLLDEDSWRIVDERKVDPAKYGPGYGHPQKTQS